MKCWRIMYEIFYILSDVKTWVKFYAQAIKVSQQKQGSAHVVTKPNYAEHFHLQPFLNIPLCNCFILYYKHTFHSAMQFFSSII